VSITDRVLDALKAAMLLESRVTSLAENVGHLAKDVREVDKRLVRVETVIEMGVRGRSGSPFAPPAIEDNR